MFRSTELDVETIDPSPHGTRGIDFVSLHGAARNRNFPYPRSKDTASGLNPMRCIAGVGQDMAVSRADIPADSVVVSTPIGVPAGAIPYCAVL